MRIALCFSGQPRSFQAGYEYYKRNLLNIGLNVDVFLHSWNSAYNQQILDLYQPKDYLFEDYLFGPECDAKYTRTPDAIKWPPRFTVSSYYSIFQSCLLKAKAEVKEKEYDWVIRTRFDYALNCRLPFQSLEKYKLYIPNCRMNAQRNFGNDQFTFGDSAVMTRYMSTYLYLDNYYNRGVRMNGEDMLSANIQVQGLGGENLVYVYMNNPFPPGPHNGTWHSLIRDDINTWK